MSDATRQPNDHVLPTLLTRADVCRELQLGDRALSQWIARGDWPPPDVVKGRKFRRWTRARFLDAVEQLTTQGAAMAHHQ